MLFALLICLIAIQGANAATCKLPAALIEAATTAHNDIRAQVAKRALDKEIYGDLPGTKSLFKLEYDCTNEGFALSTIGKDCKHSSIYMSVIGRGENSITYRADSKPGNKKLAEMLKWAVEDWRDTVESPLSADVMYTNTSLEPFANIIYNKTLKFGCSYRFCEKGKVAIACVYENKPQLNEPLYSADSTGKKGCTKNNPCNKVIKGAVCETAGDTVGPLCEREPPSSTSTSSATTAAASTLMTKEMRDELLGKLNYYRSELAKGNVRNGREGKANLPVAKDMYAMRYDMTLEKEAQAAADKCDVTSEVQSKDGQIAQLNETSFTEKEVLLGTQESWFWQILKNGMNYQMQYTETLESEPSSPIAFTRMGWAKSYKVGCGMTHCNGATAIVCRYDPPGNQYGQYVYTPGSESDLCASCSDSCNDGLCPAPMD